VGDQPLTPVTAYLGLGSNLGNPVDCLRQAVQDLEQVERLSVIARSSVWRTAPVGPVRQPDFANQVVAVSTTLKPQELLLVGQELERRFERRRVLPQGPRSLDVDLLLYGDRVIREAGLVVPHPRMHQRLFVLAPLAEIAPELQHPELGRTVEQLRDGLGKAQRVEPWAGR
jgi:2-amino-4-hydroxy-6-hydroxymethyldihydropteridine diphosphokinase